MSWKTWLSPKRSEGEQVVVGSQQCERERRARGVGTAPSDALEDRGIQLREHAGGVRDPGLAQSQGGRGRPGGREGREQPIDRDLGRVAPTMTVGDGQQDPALALGKQRRIFVRVAVAVGLGRPAARECDRRTTFGNGGGHAELRVVAASQQRASHAIPGSSGARRAAARSSRAAWSERKEE